MSPLEQLTQGLSREQMQEFADALSYLDQRLNNNMGQSPEGSSSAILNKLSPAVRQRFQMLSEFIEQPRALPFQPKRSEAQNMDALGIDPTNGGIIKDSLDGNEVTSRVIDRLGGADRPSQSPPSLRELLAASVDAHSK